MCAQFASDTAASSGRVSLLVPSFTVSCNSFPNRPLFSLKQLFQTLLIPVDTVPTANLGPPILYRHLGSGSGGYAASVLIYAAAQLFDMTISDVFDDPRVIVRQLQNRDFQVKRLSLK